MTAYGPSELQAEVLLGYGMLLLHQLPILSRDLIDQRIPVGLRASGLARQVELLKVVPEFLSTDELSKLWTALQARFRPSVSYAVSVVLIEPEAPARVPRAVLSRGPVDPVTSREHGVLMGVAISPSLPLLSAAHPPNQQSGASLGQMVELEGDNLSGLDQLVVLDSPLHSVHREVQPLAGGGRTSMRFTVPNAPMQLPVGIYGVRASVRSASDPGPRESNQLSLAILPSITNLPTPVVRDSQGTATVSVQMRPRVRPYQRASLLIGGRAVASEPRTTATDTLTFAVTHATPGTYLAGVRIDGIDTVMVDRQATPPTFVGANVVIQ
jgi:hypothetical protein